VSSFSPKDYWNTRHSRNYGPESVGYAGLGVPFNVWMYRIRAHVVERALRRAGIDLGACDVLDIGSGTGFYIKLWERLGARTITGSDFAPFAVRSLTEMHPGHKFVELDITSDAVPELGRFDLISAFDIFYHIVDDAAYARAFHNIKALLRPGGYFVFSENFLPREREVHEHQVSRSRDEIAAVLADNGFDIVSSAPVFALMNRPIRSSSRVLARTWRAIERVAAMRDHPRLGGWLGASLYPVELFLLRTVSNGPSTQMMICRTRERPERIDAAQTF
jgi:SAM-dependent methyltransferase